MYSNGHLSTSFLCKQCTSELSSTCHTFLHVEWTATTFVNALCPRRMKLSSVPRRAPVHPHHYRRLRLMPMAGGRGE
eukprot:6175067-Pleurochrysis_carterae.AAC.4